ncbi:TetR family transcriptional regulator [Paractinoplanes abujensis]|uniref:AcrR family transcriptional regulator n=1 Tax=Paractinoplanes abujensis TaxID=882441 RepID=A0A7W7G1U5_9ACTN|nr:TetR/AcrR family transcriptional regulator [Actinoplanes abujensis]MBB4691001.1 AcrR family transcriptional regulator [Actinoplanes abujensis]GID17586.1 TetR family transcriptional regulator [Actinoplanes abujensis]
MPERRTRADAVSNRARIVQVARELLASSSELPMNAVAKAAGVGQGTLYRNFATREALLAEVYRADVDRLVASAPELLAEHDAATAFRLWLDNVADYARVKRGVLAALEGGELAAGHHDPIAEAIDRLLAAGRAEGTLRADVGASDVLLLLGFLSRPEAADRAHHVLDLIFTGLRVR